MKQSGFLARQKAERQELLNAGMRIEKQFMLDTLQMSLHQLGWGYKRIKEQQEFFDFRSRYPDIRYHGYDKAVRGVEAIGWDIL